MTTSPRTAALIALKFHMEHNQIAWFRVENPRLLHSLFCHSIDFALPELVEMKHVFF